MATVYPLDPPRSGETAAFAIHPDGPRRTLTAQDDDWWTTDTVGGVQSEVRRTENGFSVLTTTGKAKVESEWGTWREAMIHGLV
ncbi:hypothetical protein [Microbacterium sp. 77mftsu3.1]|uniref:hypothetical protein n=1 Tax=Microbacterium sp. 77mftsu3.1 TaxID=1761802 RepID=UPI00037F448F|nr:hypothetical protein [Microbacterium sp. 77mftsu3.1]SDG22542.1 hypothetical protein SAMN04488590_0241 [Microbacterium sp. 77mftsu3.1]